MISITVVVKDKNSCKLKVDRSTDAWYVPGGKIQTIEIPIKLKIMQSLGRTGRSKCTKETIDRAREILGGREKSPSDSDG